mmetsp:Transcript_83961/g.271714  ORF Transcript_83961/g.271714 Transcript_83961/m.271714 type:complete len:202 (-) Transcript_83961:37-642(-)
MPNEARHATSSSMPAHAAGTSGTSRGEVSTVRGRPSMASACSGDAVGCGACADTLQAISSFWRMTSRPSIAGLAVPLCSFAWALTAGFCEGRLPLLAAVSAAATVANRPARRTLKASASGLATCRRGRTTWWAAPPWQGLCCAVAASTAGRLLAKAVHTQRPPSSISKEEDTKSIDAVAIRICGGMAARATSDQAVPIKLR